METLDLEQWWPDLFEGLDAQERYSIVQACASNWHEGWVPNREDVSDLIDCHKGTISFDEYKARTMEKVARGQASV